MSDSALTEEIGKVAEEYARAYRVIEERRARAAARRWLRPRLRWLADHPCFLKWYIRLPHKKIPVAVYKRDERGLSLFAEFRLVSKKDLR